MRPLTQRIHPLGLKIGIWTAPFEVGERSSVYENHKDWLVHNAKDEAMPVPPDEEVPPEPLVVLVATKAAAQDCLLQTSTPPSRGGGARSIKPALLAQTAVA